LQELQPLNGNKEKGRTDMSRKYAKITTPLPGPESKKWLEKHEKAVAKPLSVYIPAVIKKGEGAIVEDLDGNTYIDNIGGLGVLNVGHSHPKVREKIHAQADAFLHTDFSVFPYQSLLELADKVTKLSPCGESKAVFFNAGAEAVENAVKIARAYTGKQAIVVFEGAFHGRTLLTMTMTSKPDPYKLKFGPFAPEIYRAPFPYCYRCPAYQEGEGKCDYQCFDMFKKVFKTQVDKNSVAAVVIELVQGEGGYIPAPKKYVQKLAEFCKENGILLIVDEIQSGAGRTSKFFATEHYGIEPDMVTFAKSIAAGMPLSGVVGKKEIMDSPFDSSIGGTYVGNQVACAAALGVLEVFEEENLLQKAEKIAELINSRGKKIKEYCPYLGDIRGLGAMIGWEFVKDKNTKEPYPEFVGNILKRAMQKGALFVKCGIYGNVIRFLTPLVIKESIPPKSFI
jgi:4-aminobutyrate aminotransferase/(S)-3-amino-2-methylpropionate transaminase